MAIRIVDVIDEATFGRVPPCADPTFDHRGCDYWEDADRGSKLRRAGDAAASRPSPAAREPAPSDNPFLPPARGTAVFNPFLVRSDDDVDQDEDNPFLPRRPQRAVVASDAPRKLALLSRGLVVFGSYAKVMFIDDDPAAYTQFGPLSAYPRALRLRDLYPQLPQAPLPAVITCIATTDRARGQGHAAQLVEAVIDDLAGRGFSAVETYPDIGAPPDATSAANPPFWRAVGFRQVVADARYPVFRRELG